MGGSNIFMNGFALEDCSRERQIITVTSAAEGSKEIDLESAGMNSTALDPKDMSLN